MDIYEYLKLDHDHVAQLFKQFEHSESRERRKQIVALVTQDLMAHAESEQETFYKTLKNYEITEEEAAHGLKEHHEIEDQIAKIKQSKEFGSGWVKMVNHLKELVEHHVKDEEGPLFRNAKKVLNEEQAYIIKEQMHYLKQKLLLQMKKKEAQEDKPLKIKKENKVQHSRPKPKKKLKA